MAMFEPLCVCFSCHRLMALAVTGDDAPSLDSQHGGQRAKSKGCEEQALPDLVFQTPLLREILLERMLQQATGSVNTPFTKTIQDLVFFGNYYIYSKFK